MPISSPRVFSSAPPEFPGLIEASVWIKSSYSSMPIPVRPRALTIPIVTVCFKPKGLPIARTRSPTRACEESAIAIVGRFVASTFNTAMSVFASVPTSFAFISRLLSKVTVMSFAPSIT